MAHAIEVAGLTKRFGEVLAVDDLSFTVDEGRIVGFLGPNGAGKTTTLRMLLGLVNATGGRGRTHALALARECGVASPRVDELLELVALTDAANRRAGGYSLGMRQR